MTPGRYVIVASLLLFLRTGIAEEDTSSHSSTKNVDQQIQALQQSNKVYEQAIKNLIQRIQQLEIQVRDTIQSDATKEKESGDSFSPEMKARLQKESEENTLLIQSAFEQRLSKEGGALLGKYQFVYEPGLSLSYSSYDKVVVDGFTVFPILVIGDIVSEQVEREAFTNTHSLSFGLGQDMQFDFLIPYGYEKEELFREDGLQEENRTSGLGDISLSLSYQLIKSSSDWPDTIVAFSWKTKTGEDPYGLSNTGKPALGSGFNTYRLSFTSIANSDPIVLFGGYSINYTGDEWKNIGLVHPGISNGFNLGMALALNFDTSLSFSLQFLHTDKTKINGVSINGSDTTTSTFGVGLSIATGTSYSVDVDLGIGLTAYSPDFQLTVSFPLNYSF